MGIGMEKKVDLKRAVNVMIAQEGLTQKRLAEAAGYKTVSAVSTPIAKGDIMLSTLCRLAGAAGYSVCLIKDGAKFEDYPPIKVLVTSDGGKESDRKKSALEKGIYEPILKEE